MAWRTYFDADGDGELDFKDALGIVSRSWLEPLDPNF